MEAERLTHLEHMGVIAALRAVIESAPGDPPVLLAALRKLESRAALWAVTGTPDDTPEVSSLCGPARNIERTIEQAWRNGWGSALLMIQNADEMVQDDMSRRMRTKEWVKVIDPLLEDALAVVREEGRMAVGPEDGGR